MPHVVEALEAADVTVASFSGATPRNAREKAVADLQNGDAAVLVSTISAAGVGLTLTAASRIIFFEPILDVAAFRQAIGRAHRIGQKRSVAVAVLAAAGTHEHIALDLLTKRLTAEDECDQRVLKQRRLAKTFKLL